MKIKLKRVFTSVLKVSPLFFCLFACIDTASASKRPLLRCNVSYAGTTEQIDTRLSTDPYQAKVHDIGGRFSFKAVMIGQSQNNTIQYIKLYAYLQGRDFDIPIHQATYSTPILITKEMRALTPFNHLYAGEVEREMQYQCFLGWSTT